MLDDLGSVRPAGLSSYIGERTLAPLSSGLATTAQAATGRVLESASSTSMEECSRRPR